MDAAGLRNRRYAASARDGGGGDRSGTATAEGGAPASAAEEARGVDWRVDDMLRIAAKVVMATPRCGWRVARWYCIDQCDAFTMQGDDTLAARGCDASCSTRHAGFVSLASRRRGRC